ncbi:MAG TPA: D-aminoacyl-tRNA deacylase [Phycisphaerae bacterium]|nr:D-aminoacyl-tRNA deacylase [Phycisphaerae bacterium]
MRAIVQRVSRASVAVGESIIGRIESGLLVYIGVGHGDDKRDVEWLATKIRYLRIFEDSEGKMNLDVEQAAGAILAISSFSLFADAAKGRRPAFTDAAPPELANSLYERLCDRLAVLGIPVERGRFRETMAVESVNAGPINIWLDSKAGGSQAAANRQGSTGIGRDIAI